MMSDVKTWKERVADLHGAYAGHSPMQHYSDYVQAEISELRARVAELGAEQLETRRKHREDYEALHDAVAQVATLRVELAALEGQQGEPVAWADDAAIEGRVGNVCSTAAKRYWEKSDWVDRKNAELHKHPLYAGAREAQPMLEAEREDAEPVATAEDYPLTDTSLYTHPPEARNGRNA